MYSGPSPRPKAFILEATTNSYLGYDNFDLISIYTIYTKVAALYSPNTYLKVELELVFCVQTLHLVINTGIKDATSLVSAEAILASYLYPAWYGLEWSNSSLVPVSIPGVHLLHTSQISILDPIVYHLKYLPDWYWYKTGILP